MTAYTVTIKQGADKQGVVERCSGVGMVVSNLMAYSNRNFRVQAEPQHVALMAGDADIEAITELGGLMVSPLVQATAYVRKMLSSTEIQSNTNNWALAACSSRTDPFSASRDLYAHIRDYAFDGAGVDYVQFETQWVQAGHAEWISGVTGQSRFVQVDWPTRTGLTQFSQGPTVYSSSNDRHATASAGLACGRLFGWAKEATIHSLGFVGITPAISLEARFSMVRIFHTTKADPSRPTVCNINVLIGRTPIANPDRVRYRGADYSIDVTTQAGRNSAADNYGVPYFTTSSPAFINDYYPSIVAEIEDAVSAGVIFVSSLGNESCALPTASSVDYDNFVYQSASPGAGSFYNRHTMAHSQNVTAVGAFGISTVGGKERLATFTNRGPRCDVFAPGELLVAPDIASPNADAALRRQHPLDSSSWINFFGGTSAAGPFAAGLACLVAQARPWINSIGMRAALIEMAVNSRLHAPATGLSDTTSLAGAENRVLFNALAPSGRQL